MFKGFYNLTSGMYTHQQNLNVVGNNLVNVSTPGYKESRYTASTFDDVMYARVGNVQKVYTDIGRQSYIRANSEVYVNQDQGIPESTNIPLDFAIYGEGFFAVQGEDGQVSYTRAGSFSLDDEGYLCFPGQGRVLDPQGNSILLATDKIEADTRGNIFAENGAQLGQLGVYTFPDLDQLEYNDQGMFTGSGAAGGRPPRRYKRTGSLLLHSLYHCIRPMSEAAWPITSSYILVTWAALCRERWQVSISVI